MMVSLAEAGTTMLCVTHEMSFALQVIISVIFMNQGEVIKKNTQSEHFYIYKHNCANLFLGKNLGHLRRL